MFPSKHVRTALGFALLAASIVLPSQEAWSHKDPAPLPDNLVDQVLSNQHDRHARASDSDIALRRHLGELGRLVQDDAPNAAVGESKRMLLVAKRHELLRVQKDVLANIDQTRNSLRSSNDAEQLAKWDALRSQVLERFNRLDSALTRVDTDDLKERKRSLDHVRTLWSELHGKLAGQAMLPDKPLQTFHTDFTNIKREIQPTKQLPQYLLSRADQETHYASLDNTLVALAPSTAGWTSTCTGYTSADLAATPDAPQTAEIQSLAAQLGYSAARIYEYVYNNIQFEPYYGSLKGAQATLQTQAGGPTDQASLMIALLRASGIPARYVKGVAAIGDPAADPTGGRVARWTGAKSYAGAKRILTKGAFAVEDFTVGTTTPAQVGLSVQTVWVEACVPYAHYRGAALDNSGARWLPFDPSFKEKTYQPGLSNSQVFDYSGYLAKRKNGPDSLPHEAYAVQVEAAVRASDPNATLQDVPYTGSIDERRVDILPSSLPYAVSSFSTWTAGSAPETSQLPDAHRYRFYVDGLNLASRFSVSLPDVILNRITLSFKGYTAPDQNALTNWLGDGDTGSGVPCTVNVTPVLMIEGVVQPLQTNSGSSLGLCSKSNTLNMEIGLAEWAPSAPTTDDPNAVGRINSTAYTNIAAASWYALQAYGFQASDALISQRVAGLTSNVANISTPNSSAVNLDKTEGELLHVVGLKYMRYITAAHTEIGGLLGASGQSGNHLGLAGSQSKISYLFDLPFAVYRDGFFIDVAGGQGRSAILTSGNIANDDLKLWAYVASAYESYVWQESAKHDAVSTVRGLQYANEQSIPVYSATSSNWSTIRSQLQVSSGSGPTDCTYAGASSATPLYYPRCVIDDPSKGVQWYINNGYTVTLPKTLINYSNWIGSVVLAENYGATKSTVAALISKFNGGWLVGTDLFANDYIDFDFSGVGASYVNVPEVPTYQLADLSTNAYNQAALNLAGVSGQLDQTTNGGDPVNLVSGNLYHNETDISIKGRGGLPIVFKRSYNSRIPVDGPLGYGWTHSFNSQLKFYGVDGTLAKVSWLDGSGAERYFSTSGHTSGNITLNSTISSLTSNTSHPAGVFVTFKRAADGTFTIQEKNGLVYKFASVTGPSGVPGTATPVYAKLLSITDRNGNALALNYTAASGCGADGTVLSTVTDAVSRSLTFTYSGCHITQIKDFTGRTWSYGYTDGNNNLNSFKNPLAVAGKQNGVSYAYFTATDGQSLAHAMKTYTLPRGNGMKFEYYSNGRVFRHTVLDTHGAAQADQVNLFTYNDFRRETVQTDERGGESHYFFDPFGNPIKIVDANGAEHTYSYDCGDPSKAPGTANTSGSGATGNGCPNPYNRLTETNPAGYTTTYAYDASGSGNVVTVTQPRGASANMPDYNGFGQPRRVQDARGNWTLLIHDAKGNLTDSIRMVSGYTPASCASAECAYPTDATKIVAWTVNAYDSVGNLTSIKRVRDFAAQLTTNTALSNTGAIVTFSYDSNQLNATSTSRIGTKNADTSATTVNTATLGYDSLGRLTSGVDADWYPTQFKYDDLDRIVQGTDKLGNLRSYQFDANGNPVGQSLKVADSIGQVLVDSSSARYDDFDRVVAAVDAGGNATAYTYDGAGNLLTVTNPDNYSKTFEYDAANHAKAAFDQQQHRVSTTRDTSGRVRTVTDPNGHSVTYGYWDATRDGRVKTVTSPPTIADNGSSTVETGGRSLQYDYDATGNVISVTEIPASGSSLVNRITTTAFDELNRPTRIVGPQYTDASHGAVCPVTRYTYDPIGAPTTVASGYTPSPCTNRANDVTTGSGTSTQLFVYDDFGRKVKSTDGLNRSWVTSYDSNNNVSLVTDPKSQITTYTWSTGHQLKTRVEQGGRTTSYTRNVLGQVLTITHPEVNYSYTYDITHRLTQVADSRSKKSLAYSWSPGGLLNSITDGDGRQTNYLYDAVGRLSNIAIPSGDNLTYVYDAGGRVQQAVWASGPGSYFSYYKDNSPRGVHHYASYLNNTVLSKYDYTYDGVGNRNGLTEVVNTTSASGSTTTTATTTTNYAYTYDELKQLTQVTNGTATQQENYTYDPAGNRLTRSVGQSSPTVTAYKYDLANQLIEIHSGSATGPLVSSFTHDSNGNITSDGTRTYTWDALDQLQQVTSGSTTVAYGYDSEGRRTHKTTGGVTTNWLYDGQNIYAEYGTAWGNPNAVYTQGSGTDHPLTRTLVTGASTYGQTSYYFADGQGSVGALTNSTDSTTQTQRFDAWGNKLAGNIPQSAQYGYTGREPDETGLVYYRARYYSPSVGRFVGRDPAGLAGGINPYAYVSNNPVNLADPSGLLPKNPVSSVDTGMGFIEAFVGGLFSGTPGNQSLIDTGSGGGANDQQHGSEVQVASGINSLGGIALGGRIVPSPGLGLSGAGVAEGLFGGLGRLLGPLSLAVMPSSLGDATVYGVDGVQAAKVGVIVYRVWGGEAGQYGRSWTPVDPRYFGSSYRDLAGLPNVNAGTMLSTGTIIDPKGIIFRPAIPLDGNRGGIPEFVVPNPAAQLKITNTQVVNPPF